MAEDMLRVDDIVYQLQVNPRTVHRWIKAGKLAAYRPGKEYRIARADYEAFLAKYYVSVEPPITLDDDKDKDSLRV